MPVFKTTLTVTVMQEADSAEEAARTVAEIGLVELAYEINGGSWIGTVNDGPTVEVSADMLVGELKAIGNDGSFFDEWKGD
jgi:hypothetical protein